MCVLMRGSRAGIASRLYDTRAYSYLYYFGKRLGKWFYNKQTTKLSPVVVIKGDVNKNPPLSLPQVDRCFKESIVDGYIEEMEKEQGFPNKSWKRHLIRDETRIYIMDDCIFLMTFKTKEGFSDQETWDSYKKTIKHLTENISLENGVSCPFGFTTNEPEPKKSNPEDDPMYKAKVKITREENKSFGQIGEVFKRTKRGYLVMLNGDTINVRGDSIEVISKLPQIGDRIRVTGEHLDTYKCKGYITKSRHNDGVYQAEVTFPKKKKNGKTWTTVRLKRENFELVSG